MAELFNMKYIYNTNQVASGKYYWYNLKLLEHNLRPAFMIQWIDFKDIIDYYKVLLLIQRDYINIKFFKIDQGMIVTYNRDNIVSELVTLYSNEISSEYKDKLLGLILGYPCAGEIYNVPINRHFIEMYINNIQLMVNVYQTEESKQKFIELFNRVREVFKDVILVIN